MKKRVRGTCPYCFRAHRDLNTKEHVIPRGWFDHDSFPYKKPIIIYVCSECNNSKSENDEWMRMWLTSLAFEKSPAAQKIMMTKVRSSVEQGTFRPQFQKHYNNMELIDRLPNGVYLPQPMTKISILPEDWERAKKYVNQVIKGIFFHQNKILFPKTHDLETFFALDGFLNLRQNFKPMFSVIQRNDWHLDDASVFFYGMSKVVDEDMWLCVSVFYNTIPLLSFIGPQEWIEENRRLYGKAH
jgi:hypothetical protein